MPAVLPPLYEGHAPILLHQAFHDALEAFEEWKTEAPEPFVEFDGSYVAVSAVFGRMRRCTDILPARTLDIVREVVGEAEPGLSQDEVTFAHAALMLRALCVERLKS